MDLRIPDVGLSTSLPRAILVHFVRDIMVGLSRLPSPLPSPNGRGVDAALDNDDSIFIGVNSLSLWERGRGEGKRDKPTTMSRTKWTSIALGRLVERPTSGIRKSTESVQSP